MIVSPKTLLRVLWLCAAVAREPTLLAQPLAATLDSVTMTGDISVSAPFTGAHTHPTPGAHQACPLWEIACVFLASRHDLTAEYPVGQSSCPTSFPALGWQMALETAQWVKLKL